MAAACQAHSWLRLQLQELDYELAIAISIAIEFSQRVGRYGTFRIRTSTHAYTHAHIRCPMRIKRRGRLAVALPPTADRVGATRAACGATNQHMAKAARPAPSRGAPLLSVHPDAIDALCASYQ